MNSVIHVIDALRNKFPRLEVVLDAADTPNGISWVDLKSGRLLITIESRPHQGFGLYFRGEEGLGSRPDEVYRDTELLLNRLNRLLDLASEEDCKTESGPSASDDKVVTKRGKLDVFRAKLLLKRRKFHGGVRRQFEDNIEHMTLKDIRELLGVTQAEVAKALGRQQSAISKIEQREDILVSTLVSLIHSLGGSVEIKAHFKNCDLPIYMDGKLLSRSIVETSEEC